MNWPSPNAALEAHAVARALILELVQAYQATGNTALGGYDDGGEPLPVAAAFRALLASSTLLPVLVPELMTYLEQYPHGQPAGAEEFFDCSRSRARASTARAGSRARSVRSVISRRSRSAVRSHLEHFKRQVERTAPRPF